MYMYVCIYVCTYIYMCIYVHTHTHNATHIYNAYNVHASIRRPGTGHGWGPRRQGYLTYWVLSIGGYII